MSDTPPDGARPRATLPLGPGPYPSPAAARHAGREVRATVAPPGRRPARELPALAPELPEYECSMSEPGPAPVEPHRGAQLPARDVAPAPRQPPALRAPVRRGERWPAPSLARLVPVLALIAVLGPAALAVMLAGHPAAPSPSCASARAPEPAPPAPLAPELPDVGSELPELRHEPALPELRADVTRRAAPRVRRAPASGPARPKPTSDVVDPWRH
jgi:hypothetical protein